MTQIATKALLLLFVGAFAAYGLWWDIAYRGG
jgi:hypothetical protein